MCLYSDANVVGKIPVAIRICRSNKNSQALEELHGFGFSKLHNWSSAIFKGFKYNMKGKSDPTLELQSALSNIQG
jgi:hypothetical protein